MDRYIYTHSVASYHRRKQMLKALKVILQTAYNDGVNEMRNDLQSAMDSVMMKALNAILEDVGNG